MTPFHDLRIPAYNLSLHMAGKSVHVNCITITMAMSASLPDSCLADGCCKSVTTSWDGTFVLGQPELLWTTSVEASRGREDG